MNRHSRYLAVVVLIASMSGARAAGVEPVPAIIPIPGGVVDAAGKVGYVTGESGAIEALDLDNGKVLWTSKDANKPLAVLGKKLLAQAVVKASAVRIVVLDGAQDGKKVLESEAIAFPDWVTTGVAYGRSFTSSGAVDKKDLLFKWQARSFYAGGARPTPEIEKAARRDAHGTARINLETGKVELLDDDKVPATETPKPPKDQDYEKSLHCWTGNLFAAVVYDDKTGHLSLNRWTATGKQIESIELLKGKSLAPMFAGDGRHVLVKEQPPEGAAAWLVFSLETGQQVGKLTIDATKGGVVIVGEHALVLATGQRKGPPRPGTFDQSRTLKAFDLKTGKLVWEHDLEPIRTLPPLP